MKPIIAKTDYDTLKSALSYLGTDHKTKEIPQLVEELERGKIVNENEIEPNIIRINSYFEAVEEKTAQVFKFTLTLPSYANFKEKKLSVLSPLGIALIGFKEGMTVDCTLPIGNKKLKITRVINEKKAA